MSSMIKSSLTSKAKLYCEKIYTKVFNTLYFYDDTAYSKEENDFGKMLKQNSNLFLIWISINVQFDKNLITACLFLIYNLK